MSDPAADELRTLVQRLLEVRPLLKQPWRPYTTHN